MTRGAVFTSLLTLIGLTAYGQYDGDRAVTLGLDVGFARPNSYNEMGLGYSFHSSHLWWVSDYIALELGVTSTYVPKIPAESDPVAIGSTGTTYQWVFNEGLFASGASFSGRFFFNSGEDYSPFVGLGVGTGITYQFHRVETRTYQDGVLTGTASGGTTSDMVATYLLYPKVGCAIDLDGPALEVALSLQRWGAFSNVESSRKYPSWGMIGLEIAYRFDTF